VADPLVHEALPIPAMLSQARAQARYAQFFDAAQVRACVCACACACARACARLQRRAGQPCACAVRATRMRWRGAVC
jgi:hypothetical protein